MVLVANSGAVKTAWSVLYEGTEVLGFTTADSNLDLRYSNNIVAAINRNLDQEIINLGFKAVYFYGFYVNEIEKSSMREALESVFEGAEVVVSQNSNQGPKF
ncbi:hypothetical protein [Pedobacter sp.]|uniref:hypothetical protein n=1 Tax=Pedobacter sp. TaxID=1411316 RepID=UPI003BA9EAF9